MWPWPLTLKFDRVLEVTEVHDCAEFDQANCSGLYELSWWQIKKTSRRCWKQHCRCFMPTHSKKLINTRLLENGLFSGGCLCWRWTMKSQLNSASCVNTASQPSIHLAAVAVAKHNRDYPICRICCCSGRRAKTVHEIWALDWTGQTANATARGKQRGAMLHFAAD